MEYMLLIKYGEIMLKGQNRPYFESQLIRNIRFILKQLCEFKLIKTHGRIFINIEKSQFSEEEIAKKVSNVFGIVSVCLVKEINSNLDEISKELESEARKAYSEGFKTFKIETKRSDKTFRPNSMEVSKILGGVVLDILPEFSVNVRTPEVIFYVEIRKMSYIYYKQIRGNGGMPVGSAGKGVLLLSGGIDSPVAGYMALKRGLKLEGCYFHSHPYTTEQAKEKVIDLAKKLSIYNNGFKLHIVNFTNIQLEIYEKCPHAQLTIIMRRVMMMIAEKIAEKSNGKALITGESLGQVASQTIESLTVTNMAVDMIVLRPLIGMDKIDVIKIAEKIDTYETSILPYEDCCTIFVAKHPETKPRIDKILLSEENISINDMVEFGVNNYETVVI